MSTAQSLTDATAWAASAPWPDLPWFAIRAKPRSEFRAYDELSTRGFECFLPLRKLRHRWSDRIKTIDDPLFPSYLFSRFELASRFRILNSPGVAQILGCGNTPLPVTEAEIQSIRALVASQVALEPWPFLRIGQTVRIAYGPLAGVEGVVIRADDGKPRIVVSVNLLQRAVCAEVERDWIC